MTLTKEQLLRKLKFLSMLADLEIAHSEADQALLDFIDDDEIRSAFNSLDKWYA